MAILDNWWDQCTPFGKRTAQWLFGPNLVSFHPVVLMKILRFKTFYLIRSNGKVIRDIFRRGPFKEYRIQDWSNICLVVLKEIERWKVNRHSWHFPLCQELYYLHNSASYFYERDISKEFINKKHKSKSDVKSTLSLSLYVQILETSIFAP